MRNQAASNPTAWGARSPTVPAAIACLFVPASLAHAGPRPLSREVLRTKIRGAWAGQMIGVVFGAPTEFTSLAKLNEHETKTSAVSNAIVQDDRDVERTFAQVMDPVGLNDHPPI